MNSGTMACCQAWKILDKCFKFHLIWDWVTESRRSGAIPMPVSVIVIPWDWDTIVTDPLVVN